MLIIDLRLVNERVVTTSDGRFGSVSGTLIARLQQSE